MMVGFIIPSLGRLFPVGNLAFDLVKSLTLGTKSTPVIRSPKTKGDYCDVVSWK